MLVGSLRVRSGGGADRGPGGHDSAGGEEQPADAAALCSQTEGDCRWSSITQTDTFHCCQSHRLPPLGSGSQNVFFFFPQAVTLDSVEVELSHIVEEQKSWDKETRGLRSQLHKAEEMVRDHFLCLSHTHAHCLRYSESCRKIGLAKMRRNRKFQACLQCC